MGGLLVFDWDRSENFLVNRYRPVSNKVTNANCQSWVSYVQIQCRLHCVAYHRLGKWCTEWGQTKVSVSHKSWLPRNNRKTYYNAFAAEMSRLWNFLVRVQSWSDKIESDPVLIRKIFENHQSDSFLIRPCKSCIFILPHEAKAPLELFCLQPNMIGWRQNSCSSAFASWGKISIAFWHFQNLTRQCLFCLMKQKHFWS